MEVLKQSSRGEPSKREIPNRVKMGRKLWFQLIMEELMRTELKYHYLTKISKGRVKIGEYVTMNIYGWCVMYRKINLFILNKGKADLKSEQTSVPNVAYIGEREC